MRRGILALLLCVGVTAGAVARPARHSARPPTAGPAAVATPTPTPAPTPAPVDAGVPEVKPIAWTHEARPNQVKLGEPFQYEITFTHLPAERYELRTPRDLGAFELEETARSREDGPAQSKTTFHLKLALFELGTRQIPDLSFDVVSASGVHVFTVPGVEVEGLSSLPKDADAKGASLVDIKPPEDVPVRSYRLAWALLAVVLLGLAAYFLRRYLKRPRAARPVRALPVLPLDVRTRRALEALKSENLPLQAQGRQFYFRLSEILRSYLGERYAFEALECTSAELLARVEALRARELPFSELRHFVEDSDFVKFAKKEPTPEECDEALAFGHLLVTRTYAPPAPAPDHAAGPVLP